MNSKNFSSEEFASLSQAEQLQYFNELLKDIPLDDLKMLRDALPEISRIQQIFMPCCLYDV